MKNKSDWEGRGGETCTESQDLKWTQGCQVPYWTPEVLLFWKMLWSLLLAEQVLLQCRYFVEDPLYFQSNRGFSAICTLVLSQSRNQFLGLSDLHPSLLSVMRLTANIPEICHFIHYTVSKGEQSLNSWLSFSLRLSLSEYLQFHIKKATFSFFLIVSDQWH